MESLLEVEVREIVLKKISSVSESDIEICVGEAFNIVKEYCNITEIPVGLKYTIVNIACDIVKFEYIDKYYSDEQKVKSISRGDTSISYSDSALKDKDQITKIYIRELNKYRKLRR